MMALNPLELVDYLFAGVALLIGIGVGRRMRPKPPQPLRPMCSCRHGYGAHRAGGECAGRVQEESKWYDGSPIAWTMVECSCMHYDGPSPDVLGIERAGGR